ncbi:MAG: 50S ribosomal protein L17 [Bacteroidales bacterium]|nr:50S ribosomal protein L17 [Bacteroidales bacterium]
MRHNRTINHLGRKSEHRKAMLANMAVSLIKHKRIITTLAKAKALRKYIEPLITRSKNDTTHNRRVVFSYLQNKEAIKILFNEISKKIENRPGGYTRILRIGNRPGDNAKMSIIELVDYNEYALKQPSAETTATKEKTKVKKTRRAGKKTKKSINNDVEKSDNNNQLIN